MKHTIPVKPSLGLEPNKTEFLNSTRELKEPVRVMTRDEFFLPVPVVAPQCYDKSSESFIHGHPQIRLYLFIFNKGLDTIAIS